MTHSKKGVEGRKYTSNELRHKSTSHRGWGLGGGGHFGKRPLKIIRDIRHIFRPLDKYERGK